MRSIIPYIKATENVSNADVLYHGSHTKLDSIDPHVSTHGIKVVYAAADYNFALCYAGNQWNDYQISQTMYNGKLVLTEIQKGAFNRIFNTSGYVYTLQKTGFKQFNRHEYVNHTKVYPLECEVIDNVLDTIKKSDIELYYYPSLPPFIKSREEYIKAKDELFRKLRGGKQ